MTLMLPLLRQRTRRPRVLLAATFRCGRECGVDGVDERKPGGLVVAINAGLLVVVITFDAEVGYCFCSKTNPSLCVQVVPGNTRASCPSRVGVYTM